MTAQVFNLNRPFLLVLDADFGMDRDEVIGTIRTEIEEIAGHDRFLVLHVPPDEGEARVIGLEELRAEVADALDEALGRAIHGHAPEEEGYDVVDGAGQRRARVRS